jgi:hypothetical protein
MQQGAVAFASSTQVCEPLIIEFLLRLPLSLITLTLRHNHAWHCSLSRERAHALHPACRHAHAAATVCIMSNFSKTFFFPCLDAIIDRPKKFTEKNGL